MDKRKLNGNQILEKLIDTILLCLDELFEVKSPSEFNEGDRYAYIECLEVISLWSEFSKYNIDDVETKYPI